MKHALQELLPLLLDWYIEAWTKLGARGAWRGVPIDGFALSGDSNRPLNRAERRAFLRSVRTKRLDTQGFDRVAEIGAR